MSSSPTLLQNMPVKYFMYCCFPFTVSTRQVCRDLECIYPTNPPGVCSIQELVLYSHSHPQWNPEQYQHAIFCSPSSIFFVSWCFSCKEICFHNSYNFHICQNPAYQQIIISIWKELLKEKQKKAMMLSIVTVKFNLYLDQLKSKSTKSWLLI